MPSDDRSDELLRRARRLQQKAQQETQQGSSAGDGAGQYNWFARKVRSLRQTGGAMVRVGSKLAPIYRPFSWLFRAPWRALRACTLFATCNKDGAGVRALSQFSLRRLLISAAVASLLVLVFGSWYVYGTRERGRFIISNYQLVDIERDAYQMGGCPKTHQGQTECAPGQSEIMLVHPDWLSTVAQFLGADEGVLGIDAFLFDEIAGGIPQQGECELSRYGVYLRPPPLFRFLRGATKRHVVFVGTCEVYGIRAAGSSSSD